MSLAQREPLQHPASKTSTAWNSKQQTFQRWLALPVYQRQPKLQQQLATQLTVSEELLSRWKQRPGFWDEVVKYERELVRDLIPDAILGLQIQIERGNYQAIKDVLMHGGVLDPQPTTDVDVRVGVGVQLVVVAPE